ncbi:hypothetical protein [Halomonas sp. I5-271120]|uniref:hypothetical protein n=1 Tax=Halomonas sp. I5-271120 TaxID=3061632 RepID=UPI002714E557|nr:hypothetical protein [Halomonas sp. I5-271120]
MRTERKSDLGADITTIAPCAGALVQHGQVEEQLYRVAAYMKMLTETEMATDTGLEEIFGAGYESSMAFCPRNEATHLALSGPQALIVGVGQCRVVGRAPWTCEQLRAAHAKAESLGQSRKVV